MPRSTTVIPLATKSYAEKHFPRPALSVIRGFALIENVRGYVRVTTPFKPDSSVIMRRSDFDKFMLVVKKFASEGYGASTVSRSEIEQDLLAKLAVHMAVEFS